MVRRQIDSFQAEISRASFGEEKKSAATLRWRQEETPHEGDQNTAWACGPLVQGCHSRGRLEGAGVGSLPGFLVPEILLASGDETASTTDFHPPVELA
jgi:hypothetical protein